MRGIGKLRSRSGATMVLALLVFMLCIFVGTAALTAAAANSGRYTHLKEEEQAYLNVSSAAKLFRDEFLENEFSANVVKVDTMDATGTITDTKISVDNEKVENATDPTKDAGKIPGQFEGYLKSAMEVKENATSHSSVDAPSGFTVTYGDDVTVTCKAEGYNLTLTFSQGDSFKTVLTLVGTVSYPTQVGTDNYPKVETVADPTAGTVTTTTTKVATVSWSEENAHISEPSKVENN